MMGFFSSMPQWVRENIRLQKGSHGGNPAAGVCIMEFVSLIAPSEKGRMSDHPSCVNDTLKSLSIGMNDRVLNDQRQRVIELAARFINTTNLSAEEKIEWRDNLRIFCHNLEAKYTGVTIEAALKSNGGSYESVFDTNKTWEKAKNVALTMVKAIQSKHGENAYNEEYVNLIHSILPKDRPQAADNIDWLGAARAVKPDVREQWGLEIPAWAGGPKTGEQTADHLG